MVVFCAVLSVPWGIDKLSCTLWRHPRFAGVSKFSVRKMIRFALDGVTAFSRVPLRAALYVGVLCGGLSFLLILHLLYVYLTGQALNGWTTLGVSILFIGGIQLVGLGIIGEYVGRILKR